MILIEPARCSSMSNRYPRRERYLLTLSGIIQQDFSWSPFNVTYPTIRKILAHHSVFTPFLTLLRAFGSKTKEDENIQDEFCFQSFDDLDATKPHSGYGQR